MALLFQVIRRCPPDECEPGCLCDRLPVEVDVDELGDDELAYFATHGTEAQQAEIRAWLAPPANASIRPSAPL
jgi:hypothetical protein